MLVISQRSWREVVCTRVVTTGVAVPLISRQRRFNVTSRLRRPGPHWHWCPPARSCWRQTLLKHKRANCLRSLAANFLLLSKSQSSFPEEFWKMTVIWKSRTRWVQRMFRVLLHLDLLWQRTVRWKQSSPGESHYRTACQSPALTSAAQMNSVWMPTSNLPPHTSLHNSSPYF